MKSFFFLLFNLFSNFLNAGTHSSNCTEAFVEFDAIQLPVPTSGSSRPNNKNRIEISKAHYQGNEKIIWQAYIGETIHVDFSKIVKAPNSTIAQRVNSISDRSEQSIPPIREIRKLTAESAHEYGFIILRNQEGQEFISETFTSQQPDQINGVEVAHAINQLVEKYNLDERQFSMEIVHTHPTGSPVNLSDIFSTASLSSAYDFPSVQVSAVSMKEDIVFEANALQFK